MSRDAHAHAHQDTTSNNEGNTQPAINSDSMRSGENNGGGSKTGSLVDAGTDKGKGVVKKEEEEEEEEEEERGNKGKSSADVVVAAYGRTGGHDRRGDKGHMVTERERRMKMREMFTNLQALLPNVPDKTDKATMVGVAIDYIKSLEVTVADLEKRKREMKLARGRRCAAGAGASSPAAPTQAVLPVVAHGGMPPAAAITAAPALAPAGLQTWSGPNVVLSVSGDDAYINVCASRRQGVMTMVAAVLEKHRIDVVTSEVTSYDSRSMLMIHALVNRAGSQLGNNSASEEIYKLAVSEIMVWLSN